MLHAQIRPKAELLNRFALSHLFLLGSLARMTAPISIARCPDYASAPESLERVLRALGGIERFVSRGQRVLIKPNLLSDHHPDEAVTTHPALVRALVRAVRAAGACPFVADSPASATRVEAVWEKTGYRQMCAEEQVELLNLEGAGSRLVRMDGFEFHIATPVLDAEVIINVPKVKTHVLTTLTAAVKNMYGTVPGYQKAMFHKTYPTPRSFGRLLAAIHRSLPPALSVADAVVGMDGEGPASGAPVRLGFVAASADAVALDLGLCRLLGLDPSAVPYLHSGPAGKAVTGELTFIGDTPASLGPIRFRAPSTIRSQMIPGWLVRRLQPLIWIRPRITDRCVMCGRCVHACPVEALSQSKGQPPVLTPARCIGCCCCHEICPEKAIEMRQSPLLNLVRRGKLL